MRIRMRWWGVVFFLTFLFACQIQAAPYDGKQDTLQQPDGTSVDVRIWGDEYFQHIESLAGRTLVRDADTGEICYAELSDDGSELLSTGQRYDGNELITSAADDLSQRGFSNPVRLNMDTIRKIADENKALLEAEALPESSGDIALQSEDIQPATTIYGPTNRLSGNYEGLVLLIDFSDQVATISQSSINNFCNQEGYTGYGNNGSVRDYYYDASNGKMVYTNYVTAYYRAANPKSYYEDTSVSYGTRARELIREALNNLEYNVGFDFTTLSLSGGKIRALNAMYAGNASSGWSKGLWPHKSSGINFTADGVTADIYQITDIENSLSIGTFCHENGHMLCGYPDLYDYGGESRGVGSYCLMASSGSTNPIMICPYLRYTNGWMNFIDITNDYGVVSHPLTANSDTCYYYLNPDYNSEYFIFEARRKTGRSSNLPDEGLAIWHIDRNGSNNNEQMTADSHYRVSLEQADGLFDLENDRDGGDGNDLFHSGYRYQFDDYTTPNANWWSGENSGLVVQYVSAVGNTMSFETDNAYPTTVLPGKIQAEDYSPSGEGVSYHDNTAGNIWGLYRDDDVDIQGITGESGYLVGHVQSGEWLEYAVDVEKSGLYSINLRYSTVNANQQFKLLWGDCGSSERETLCVKTLPSTGAWTNWQIFNAGSFYLEAGELQAFRIEMISPNNSYIGNFDWIEFQPSRWMDLNADNIVSLGDMAILSSGWHKSEKNGGDFNGDRFVGIEDLSYLLDFWLRRPGASLIAYEDFDGDSTGYDSGSFWSYYDVQTASEMGYGLNNFAEATGSAVDSYRALDSSCVLSDGTYYLSCLYKTSDAGVYGGMKLWNDSVQYAQFLFRGGGAFQGYLINSTAANTWLTPAISYAADTLYLVVMKLELHTGANDIISCELFDLSSGQVPLDEPSIWRQSASIADLGTSEIDAIGLRGELQNDFDNIVFTQDWVDVVASAHLEDFNVYIYDGFDGETEGFADSSSWSNYKTGTLWGGELLDGAGSFITSSIDNNNYSYRLLDASYDLSGDGVYYMSTLFKATGNNAYSVIKFDNGDGMGPQFAWRNSGGCRLYKDGWLSNVDVKTYSANTTYLAIVKIVANKDGNDQMSMLMYDITNGDLVPFNEPSDWDASYTVTLSRTVDRIILVGNASINTSFDNIMVTSNWEDVAMMISELR